MSETDMTSMPEGLAALMKRAEPISRGIPPVERWNPPFCGDLDIHIDAEARWSYLGSPIGREKLVQLFSTVLRKDEDGSHYLVTPVEKIRIRVDDAPFLAVEMHVEGSGEAQQLTFRTNVGDVVDAGKGHPLSFHLDPENNGLKPYVLVRGRLLAKLSRPLLYDLAELFEERQTDTVQQEGVWSDGTFFALPEEVLAGV